MMRRSLCDQQLREGLAQLLTCGLELRQYFALGYGALVLFGVSLAQERCGDEGLRPRLNRRAGLAWLLTFLCIASTLVFGAYGPGYNPSDFVYMQF